MGKNTIKILLVEGDKEDFLSIKRMLTADRPQSVEFIIDLAESFSEAIDHLRSGKKYDVVLLDAGLPDNNGFGTFQKIHQINECMPIIVLTGLEDEKIGFLAMQNGATDYLVKGRLSGDVLIRTLMLAIEHKEAEENRKSMLFLQLGINSLQQSLLQPIPLEEKLKKVTDNIVKFFDADICRIWLIKNGDMCQNGCIHAETKDGSHVCSRHDKCLHLVSSSGRYTHTDGDVHSRIPIGSYEIGLIASGENHRFLSNDVQNDHYVDHQWAEELELVSFAGYQLREGGQLLGVLALYSKHPIEPSEEAMLDGINSTVAMAVRQAYVSEQLQESEGQYQSLVNNSVMGVAIMDTNHRIIKVNAVFAALFKKPVCEFVGKFCFNEFEKRDMICPHCPGARALVSGKTEDVETEGVRDDGCHFYVHNRAVPFFGPDGATKGFIEMVEDIDARKRAENTLRFQKMLLESQSQASMDGILNVDAVGNIIWFNHQFLAMWKVEQNEIKLGSNITSLQCVLNRVVSDSSLIQKIKELLTNRDTKSRNEIYLKDERVFECYSSPVIGDDKYLGRIWVFHDFTNRKQAERAIIKERNKARKYLDVAGVIMLVLNRDGTIHLINHRGCKVLGYMENELIGKNWFDNFLPPAQKEQTKAMFDSLLEGAADIREYYENPILTRDGQQRLIAWHNIVMRDDKNQIDAMLCSGEDITWQREVEEKLKKSYQEIEKAYNETKTVQAQLIQSEKLASIGQLAAGVAHEMNTPVGFVASNFETLEKYLSTFKKIIDYYTQIGGEVSNMDKNQLLARFEDVKKAAKEMKMDFILEDIDALFKESNEGLSRVTAIIQNLRDFSRIDQTNAFGEFNINHGLEATLTVARNSIKYHANVMTEFSDVPHVSCNASQINQVFLNIILNSAQAIEAQQRNQNGIIKIRTYSNETHVMCEIEDDGPGIPDEYLQKVFDPFFTTKPVGKGTGLGLTISYDIIVNKHKGELYVDSVIGKGTKFTIKLPIKNITEAPANNIDEPVHLTV
jgi:PAS domain S-box-containing protein